MRSRTNVSIRRRVTDGDEQRVAVGDEADAGDELLGRDVLEQEAARAGAERVEDVLVEVEGRQYQHPWRVARSRRGSGGSPRGRPSSACGCPSARRPGRVRRAASTASSPSLPRRPPAGPSSASRIIRNPARTSVWSSAIKTPMLMPVTSRPRCGSVARDREARFVVRRRASRGCRRTGRRAAATPRQPRRSRPGIGRVAAGPRARSRSAGDGPPPYAARPAAAARRLAARPRSPGSRRGRPRASGRPARLSTLRLTLQPAVADRLDERRVAGRARAAVRAPAGRRRWRSMPEQAPQLAERFAPGAARRSGSSRVRARGRCAAAAARRLPGRPSRSRCGR